MRLVEWFRIVTRWSDVYRTPSGRYWDAFCTGHVPPQMFDNRPSAHWWVWTNAWWYAHENVVTRRSLKASR
jgi:hypothetical protein